MEYSFGIDNIHGCEILRTKGTKHSNFSGFIQIKQEFTDCIITDNFRIAEHYKSDMDVEGNCYDWYIIDCHYRETDTSEKTQEKVDQINANIDYLSMMIGIEIPTEEGAGNG